MNKLSVLIPTYNRAEFLFYALESLAKQTFKDFVVIIYDDGSNDDTGHVVRQFTNNLNIKYIKSEVNNGVSFARNELMNAVETEYFAWQDSDDISQPDRLEKQMECITEGFDACFTYAYFFRHSNKNRRSLLTLDTNKYTSRAGLFQNMAFATGLFSKKCLKYKFDVKLIKKEDVEWLTKLIKGKITFVCRPEPLYYIRQHIGRLTATKNENNNIR